MSITEFTKALYKTNKYFDGHTGISWDDLYPLEKKLPPFPAINMEDSLLLINGKQIISVNNIPATNLIELVNGATYKGMHPKIKIKKINTSMAPLLYLCYGIKSPFIIQYKNKEEIKTDTVFTRIPAQPQRKEREMTLPYYLDIYDKESIAVITYSTSAGKHETYLKDFCRLAFKDIIRKKIKYLFIDVTQNPGGNDGMHGYLYNYLLKKSYKFKIMESFSSYMFEKLVEEETQQYKENKKLTKKIANMKAYFYSHNNTYPQKRTYKSWIKGPKFKGKIFIIQSNHTYSAGADFCLYTKSMLKNNCTLVGEECGQYFPYAGNVVDAFLPNSHIQFRYATKITYDPDTYLKNGFLQPDIWYDVNKELELKDYINIIKK
ncbi:S41 family peptidase [Parabacteroides pacaensis]|uniref:S41 family peptidase n=1 Tax=Parabacteroides pacaensis TaxID=2086575 RepID=UPI00131E48CB|nr:S41 family peptidase [Parabacteroides pacaensis]